MLIIISTNNCVMSHQFTATWWYDFQIRFQIMMRLLHVYIISADPAAQGWAQPKGSIAGKLGSKGELTSIRCCSRFFMSAAWPCHGETGRWGAVWCWMLAMSKTYNRHEMFAYLHLLKTPSYCPCEQFRDLIFTFKHGCQIHCSWKSRDVHVNIMLP